MLKGSQSGRQAAMPEAKQADVLAAPLPGLPMLVLLSLLNILYNSGFQPVAVREIIKYVASPRRIIICIFKIHSLTT